MAVGCAADVVADSPSLPALVVCAVQSPGGAPAPRFCRHSPGVAPVHRHWTLVLAEASLCLLLQNENCTEHYHIPHTLSLDAVKRKKVNEADLYSAFIEVPYTQGAQVRITQCYLQNYTVPAST